MGIQSDFKIKLRGRKIDKKEKEYLKFVPDLREPVIILKERKNSPDKMTLYIGDGKFNIASLYPIADNFSVRILKKIVIILSLLQIIQFLLLLFLIF